MADFSDTLQQMTKAAQSGDMAGAKAFYEDVKKGMEEGYYTDRSMYVERGMQAADAVIAIKQSTGLDLPGEDKSEPRGTFQDYAPIDANDVLKAAVQNHEELTEKVSDMESNVRKGLSESDPEMALSYEEPVFDAASGLQEKMTGLAHDYANNTKGGEILYKLMERDVGSLSEQFEEQEHSAGLRMRDVDGNGNLAAEQDMETARIMREAMSGAIDPTRNYLDDALKREVISDGARRADEKEGDILENSPKGPGEPIPTAKLEETLSRRIDAIEHTSKWADVGDSGIHRGDAEDKYVEAIQVFSQLQEQAGKGNPDMDKAFLEQGSRMAVTAVQHDLQNSISDFRGDGNVKTGDFVSRQAADAAGVKNGVHDVEMASRAMAAGRSGYEGFDQEGALSKITTVIQDARTQLSSEDINEQLRGTTTLRMAGAEADRLSGNESGKHIAEAILKAGGDDVSKYVETESGKELAKSVAGADKDQALQEQEPVSAAQSKFGRIFDKNAIDAVLRGDYAPSGESVLRKPVLQERIQDQTMVIGKSMPEGQVSPMAEVSHMVATEQKEPVKQEVTHSVSEIPKTPVEQAPSVAHDGSELEDALNDISKGNEDNSFSLGG